MDVAVEVLRTVQVAAFLLLGALGLREWRRNRVAPAAWASAAFGVLALVAAAGLFFPSTPPTTAAGRLAVKCLIAVVLVFPYLLFRFATSFARPTRGARRAAAFLTAGVAAMTFVLPSFPRPGEARPPLFLVYVVAILVQWTYLFSYVAVRLWTAGRGQPTVARRRMRTLSLACIVMDIIVVVGAVHPAAQVSGQTLATQVIGLVAAGMFSIGLAPPRYLRTLWRMPEEAAMRDAVTALVGVDRSEEVARLILGRVARVVGASAALLCDRNGSVVGAEGVDTVEAAEIIAHNPATSKFTDPNVVRIELRRHTLFVRMSPYTPFFGRDETAFIAALASTMDLALERCRLNDQQRNFIANAAHELRTPLTTIGGLASTLSERWDGFEPDELRDCLDALNRQSDRARILIDNLLDLAQLERAAASGGARSAPLDQAGRIALEAAPPPHGVLVGLDVDEGLRVTADPQRLEQVLVNLLSNAYRYGGTSVHLEGHAAGSRVLVAVIDDGPGVAPDLVGHLFEPFSRGAHQGIRGSGLGLAIVRRIVEGYGGHVWYEPNEPSGARFTIELGRAA